MIPPLQEEGGRAKLGRVGSRALVTRADGD
jgi:hypothetical protein